MLSKQACLQVMVKAHTNQLTLLKRRFGAFWHFGRKATAWRVLRDWKGRAFTYSEQVA